jgi:hypothetical protein
MDNPDYIKGKYTTAFMDTFELQPIVEEEE